MMTEYALSSRDRNPVLVSISAAAGDIGQRAELSVISIPIHQPNIDLSLTNLRVTMVLIHRNPPPTFADTLDTKKSLAEKSFAIPGIIDKRQDKDCFVAFFVRLKQAFGVPSQAQMKAHLARLQHDPDFTVSNFMSSIVPVWALGTLICLGLYLSHLRDEQYFNLKAAAAIAGPAGVEALDIGHIAMHYVGVSLCGLFVMYISMVAVANGIKRMFSSEEERQRDTLSVYAREFADLLRI